MDLSRKFFAQLSILTLAILAFLTGISWWVGSLREHLVFTICTVLVFALLCVGLFFWGKKSAVSQQRIAFNNLILSSVFGKMAIAFAILFFYKSVGQPKNTLYILIFLVIYVVFTVFEVSFMSKLARLKKPE